MLHSAFASRMRKPLTSCGHDIVRILLHSAVGERGPNDVDNANNARCREQIPDDLAHTVSWLVGALAHGQCGVSFDDIIVDPICLDK